MPRSEDEIEAKINQAIAVKERPGGENDRYAQGVRDALGWANEEDDAIPGIDED